MSDTFEHVRMMDHAALDASEPGRRFVQRLLDKESGGACKVSVVKTPPGAGSSAGLHTHGHDQVYYLLSGVMTIEVGGTVSEVGPGGLIVFRAGEEHRNWNAGTEDTLHLSIGVDRP